MLLDRCNWGYTRGHCERFREGPGGSAEEAADAVRFSMLADGKVLRIEERDGLPVRRQSIDLAGTTAGEACPAEGVGGVSERERAQAQAYFSAYQRRGK